MNSDTNETDGNAPSASLQFSRKSQQDPNQKKPVSRLKKTLRLVWYSVGVASAVALVAVVGTQIIQGGGYDQKQRELEQSYRANNDESSTSLGTVEEARVGQYGDDTDLCSLVGDDAFIEVVGVDPDVHEKDYVSRNELYSTTMRCTIEKSIKENDRDYVSVILHAEQFVDSQSATEYYEDISRNLSNPSGVANTGLEECILADSGTADDHEFDSLFALDDNLVVSVSVIASDRRSAIKLSDELRRDLLTEYAQLIFDGLRAE